MRKNGGITLIALVITIIILLILAGITIGTLLGENGIITRATRTKEEYKIAEAREKLSLVLIDASVEKRTNIKYNQDTFLDQFIKDNLEGSKIKGDIAIVDGYAFSLDRSAPKIGEYLGEEKDLVFPNLKVDTQISSNNDSATITITTQENKNGISKIEVILDGDVVHTYDNYNNTKEEIKETYKTDKNGIYTIKAYGKLPTTEITKVEGVISPIVYDPNGSEQYAKEFQVKISVSESNEKVKNIKYQWTNSTAEPAQESFSKSIENEGTITEKELTGKYYLWTLLETESGATRTGKSEAFYFDNTGPTVKLTSTPTSVTTFTLSAEATDDNVGIKQYDFYVNNVKKETVTTSAGTATYKVTGASTGNTECYVIVTDNLGNTTTKTITAKTKLYAWEKWNTDITYKWKIEKKNLVVSNYRYSTSTSNPDYKAYKANFDTSTGALSSVRVGCPSWAGWAHEEVVYIEGKLNGYYKCTIGSGGIITDAAYYDIYSIEKKQVEDSVKKGTNKLGIVTSTNGNDFKSNQRNADGYWYVPISPQ